MKILMISNLYPPKVQGGYEILCQQVSSRLAKLGHEVSVLCSTMNLEEAQTSTDIQVLPQLMLVEEFPKPVTANRFAQLRVFNHNHKVCTQAIHSVKPDVILVWSQLRLTISATKACEESGIPTLWTANDDHLKGFVALTDKDNLRGRIKSVARSTLFSKLFLGKEQSLPSICISENLKGNLKKAGVCTTNMKVIYQGVEKPLNPPKTRTRDRKDIDLLYVGQIHHYKGVHTILEALLRIQTSSNIGGVRLRVVGKGNPEYTESLASMARKSNLNVNFLGYQSHENLGKIYQESDCLVFPSIWDEPFGLSHLEAMANGLAVISTSHGGPAEFLKHKINSMLFEKENSYQLAQRILQLRDNHDLYNKIASEGHKEVQNYFNLERYTTDIESQLIKIYKENQNECLSCSA